MIRALVFALLFVATPVFAQWASGSAVNVGTGPYDQTVVSTFTATGPTTLQDVTECGTISIAQTAADVAVGYYSCPNSTDVIPGGCQNMSNISSGQIVTPETASLGGNGYFGVRVTDAGASGGTVTMT